MPPTIEGCGWDEVNTEHMTERIADQDDPNLRPLGDGEEVEVVSLSPVAPRPVTVIFVRFDPESAVLLRRAARIENMNQAEFVRHATLEAAERCIHKEMPLSVSR